jgi:hypothetical protein
VKQFPLRSIRITTKERPTDRFLTTQVRETSSENESSRDDLYFILEIHNPWFPNSQIGQTIINTIIREYRRGESTSVLVNFELALRKTNTVLAQITQNGETDWIGNLSSLILLVTDNHIHLAQTGQAHAYLLRAGKISAITEGLEEEAGQHPLTTYTNITTGSLENNDRLILVSSAIVNGLSQAEMRDALTPLDFEDAARSLIRMAKNKRLTKANLLLLEMDGVGTTPSQNLYLDQSLSTLPEISRRLLRGTIQPGLVKTGSAIQTGAHRSVNWTRDWLVPRVITWSKRSGQFMQKTSQAFSSQAQPFLKKTVVSPAQNLHDRVKKLNLLRSTNKRALEEENQTPLIGQTIYRVHHYDAISENQPSKFRRFWKNHESEKAGPTLGELLARRLTNLKEWLKGHRFQPTKRQVWLLSLGLIVVLIVVYSATERRVDQVVEINNAEATAALAEAKTAQAAAERDFLLNDKAAATLGFLKAIELAQSATQHETTQTEATTLINQSQAILDKLLGITRFEPQNPEITFEGPTSLITKIAGTIVTAAKDAPKLYRSNDPTEETTSFSLPDKAADRGQATYQSDWLFAGSNQQLYRYTLSTNTTTIESGNWPQIQSLASYSTNLYVLDREAGQIWKYPANGATFGERTGYLKVPEGAGLENALSLAIDGDVFVLFENGSVQKYTRGVKVENWTLSGIPEPQNTMSKPRILTTGDTNSNLYILEDRVSETEPARLLEFDKNGAYLRQLVFPSNYVIDSFWFDAVGKVGLIISDAKMYPIDLSTRE